MVGFVVIGDLLPLAIGTITLALVFYTIGVFAERRVGILKRWHAVVFWCGLLFDTTGTAIMSRIAAQGTASGFGLHGVTGALAIALMLFHAIWATVVLVKKDAARQAGFHKFSIVVWAGWLVPHILGMVLGMSH